jgi:hypothetical protein
MKNELITSIVKDLTTDLDNKIDMLEQISTILSNAKDQILRLSGEETVVSQSSSSSYADNYPSKARPKKGEVSVAALTRKFLKKYYETNEQFSKETLYKRVRGLLSTATDAAIDNQFNAWARKNNLEYTSATINGVRIYSIVEKHV